MKNWTKGDEQSRKTKLADREEMAETMHHNEFLNAYQGFGAIGCQLLGKFLCFSPNFI